ncbi:MAG: DUF2330 domain-containing protein [Candidatus Eisenbacteria bacterium]|uniref:DUF2330 domain-containing protein n=1 Tax=Eiseniibacteriota bacterium TaxID=2212470 RepID=A0A849SL41_UNCEI|nr:DUF2330 domain-containing protein [Candidatus Eisenbacteria bacterium]
MKRLLPLAPLLTIALSLSLAPTAAHSFCGFYVASGNAKLFNRASQVVLVRDGDRTVMTLSNDYQGEPKQFAMVIPVPTVLQKGQIHVGDGAIIEHLDAFTAPRLVEYFDPPPCAVAQDATREVGALKSARARPSVTQFAESISLGVTIEASYTIGEYDILILSATESAGLERWLTANHYNVPQGASRVLNIYIKQNLKFFVAKVNLKEQQKLGFQKLRPIQIAYESPRFMLPIRLGMVNADGAQELFVYALTRTGRVEPVNYRSVKLPTDHDVPEYVKTDFARFCRALFTEQVRKEHMGVVFTEYMWNMSGCDPCAAAPLSADELRKLGVWWVADGSRRAGSGDPSVFVTRLHARYDKASFPEDLALQATSDQTHFQGRYVIHHPYKGDEECEQLVAYRAQLRERRRREAENLATLTGWHLDEIRTAMAVDGEWSAPEDRMKWWDRLWKD